MRNRKTPCRFYEWRIKCIDALAQCQNMGISCENIIYISTRLTRFTSYALNYWFMYYSLSFLDIETKTHILEILRHGKLLLEDYQTRFIQQELSLDGPLTHWRRATHICVSKLTIIGSDNGVSPSRRQAIIWINAVKSLIRPLGINFSEILIEIPMC